MTTRPNPFVSLQAGAVDALPASPRFEPADHLWSRPEIEALTLALAARRPLLVRGEAGSGKSQLARAAAQQLGSGPPVVEVIHPRFEALDLLYRFDAVARLSDAQLRGADGQALLDLGNLKYLSQGALWRALLAAQPDAPLPVLLIDEIDKADADVPNALLDVLGNRSFEVPYLPEGQRIVQGLAGAMPLIVITTNEERELPAAFVRRCVVLNLNPPEDEAAFIDWLLRRGRAHARLAAVQIKVARQAAAQVWADRQVAAGAGYPKVGLAEFIDLLTALDELTASAPPAQRTRQQARWLQRLSAYALVKHAKQDQGRSAVSAGQGSASDD